MRRRVILAAVSPLVVFVVPAMVGGTASAATPASVSCGDVITQSITLSQNLHCSGTALGINSSLASSPLTVNLAGHTVSSTDTSCAVGMNGRSSTLENGRVIGGVCAGYGQSDLNHLVLDGQGVVATGELVVVSVEHSLFINGATFSGGSTTPTFDSVEYSIFNGPAVGSAAVSVLTDGGSRISGNIIHGYSVGISDRSYAGATITGNTVLGSGIGIMANDLVYAPPSLVANNVVARATSDGILVNGGVDLSVTGNIAFNNGGDGIHLVPDPFTITPVLQAVVANNVAVGNGNLGIDSPAAVPPNVLVTDGGGNMAFGNGNPAQCRNISCSP